MKNDRTKWNEKFERRDDEPLPPERFIVDNVDYLKPGSVLDVACGDGRNALFLAERGFVVCGVDISEVGLERLQGFAGERDLDIETHRRDLDDEPFRGLGAFDNVVVSHFKPPESFWEQAPGLLRPNGILMLATFSIRQHEEHDFPERYCLEPEELVDVSDQLECIEYEEYEESGKYLAGYVFRRI